MRITVKESGGTNLCLRLPSGLMLNRLSAYIFSATLRKYHLEISGEQLYILCRAVKEYKAKHPQWKLVEICDQKGDIVEIVL